MDNGSIYIGIFLMVLCISPLIIFWWNRKKRENKIKAVINSKAAESQCRLTKIDTTAHMAIGADESKKCVFFYKKQNETEINQMVDLKTVSACKVLKQMENNTGGGFVEHLSLAFYFKNKKNNPINFEFYNNENNSQLGDELLLINEWQKRIATLLK